MFSIYDVKFKSKCLHFNKIGIKIRFKYTFIVTNEHKLIMGDASYGLPFEAE
jgi:hypothetical protein